MRIALITNRDELVAELRGKFNPLALIVDKIAPLANNKDRKEQDRLELDLARQDGYPVVMFEEGHVGAFSLAARDVATLRNSVGVKVTNDGRAPQELEAGYITTGTLEKPRLLALKIMNAISSMNGALSDHGQIIRGNIALNAIDPFITIKGEGHELSREGHDIMRNLIVWHKRPHAKEHLILSYREAATRGPDDAFKKEMAKLRVLLTETGADYNIVSVTSHGYSLEANKA